MATTSSNGRSHIVDYTYQHVNSLLSGHREGTSSELVAKILESRLDKLKKLSEPFEKPSNASKKKVESGSVTLADGVAIRVEDTDNEVVFAISDRFQIDQVDALILLRSFLYNEGLPPTPDNDTASSLVEELLEAITPFYFSERLYVLRVHISLLRARESAQDPFHHLASNILSKIIPHPTEFVNSLVSEYLHKTKLEIPQNIAENPRRASQWAKQNAKEQLGLVEVLFWSLWDYVSCDAPIVLRVFEAAYGSEFGHQQENATLMLDEEGTQLQRDIAALWILVTIETLNLENLADGGLELSDSPSDVGPLSASPATLEKIHNLVLGNTHPGYVCTFLAWAFYLKSISISAANMGERATAYTHLLREIGTGHHGSYTKEHKELHATMVEASLRPEMALFDSLSTLLTNSPLFVTSIARRTGSTITDPNAVAYRSVLKGLIISLVEYQPVEYISDMDGIVEVWIALFGMSESISVASLCRQYWDYDWRQGTARRALIDVARSRFPVHFRPLIRLLRSMTGAGFIDSADTERLLQQSTLVADKRLCSSYVFHYLRTLPSYTQVLSVAARAGPSAVYERIIDRPNPSSMSGGTAYTNQRPVKLPGGSVLPAKSIGRLLCSDSTTDPVVVAWQHQHSGWKILVEVLIDYVNRRQGSLQSRSHGDVGASRRGDQQLTLQLNDIGIENTDGDEDVIVDALYLVLSIIQDNPAQTETLMESLEEGGSVVSYAAKDSSPPDLVQLIITILEDALSRSQSSRIPTPYPLIAPALSVLSALLSLPNYSNRVWLYLRSTCMLFNYNGGVNFTSAVLAAERVSGQFNMTLSLLRLVRSLFEEAIGTLLLTQAEQPRLQTVKDEVLLRALRSIHGEIWVEHTGWRYARLGDRFDIGRHIVSLFSRVIETMSSVSSSSAFTGLSEFATEILINRATTSTINPLVHTVATGRSLLASLYSLRRFTEVRQLRLLLEACLRLTRFVLNLKQASSDSSKISLLEQALCADVSVGNMAVRSSAVRVNPVDILAGYVRERELGSSIPLEAIRVLTALCSSLSMCSPSPPAIIGHFSDAQAMVAGFVRIVQHPYDDLSLRNAIWSFITLAVDKEPALAGLFVSGRFHVPIIKGMSRIKDTHVTTGKEDQVEHPSKITNAVEAASETLANWKNMWEANPRLLASVMKFLDVVWHHGLEHKKSLEWIQADGEFWKQLSSIAREELGPLPDYLTSNSIELDDGDHSDLHEAVSIHSYRTIIKSHALRLIGSDIAIHSRSEGTEKKPTSYAAIESIFRNTDELFADCISESVSSSYDPNLHDSLIEAMRTSFAPLSIDSLRLHEPMQNREFGDHFMFSIPLLHDVLRFTLENGEPLAKSAEKLQYTAHSVNLNLSLAHSQLLLVEAWCYLLQHVKAYLRGDVAIRDIFMAVAASVSRDISTERRSGDMMCVIHGARLSLLLALLEVAWFTSAETKTQTGNLILLMENLGGMVASETFPPGKSFLGSVTKPFHRTLLQIVYFCATNCRRLVKDTKTLQANQRLIMGQTLTTALMLVIDALRLTFDSASTRLDADLDKDMEILVAVFEQCTRPGLHTSSTTWLTRCQETDVIHASLALLSQTDIVGLSELSLLRSRGQPLYASHVLLFHMALASIPFAAERLASEGIIACYSNNSITAAVSVGAIDTALSEFPGERSPAHRAYCMMLANVTGTMSALVSPHHFVDSQLVGFVQLFGKQISRALSWNNDEPLTLPVLEELELTVELFYLMADGATVLSRTNGPTSSILRVFTDHALQLLQHLNYALTHPKHLAGLLEPITAEERVQIERETADVAVNALSELLDPGKRPLLAKVIRRLFDVTTKILSTLIILSGAETVLIADPEEWNLHEALVVPHSKVAIGEAASIGTMLELGNCAFDILRFLISQKPPSAVGHLKPQPTSPASGWTLGDIQMHAHVARQTLECVLVYTSTQLVMWLAKHDDEHIGEMELDEQQAHQQHLGQLEGQIVPKDRERRLTRKSLTLAERLRRGMTGEMSMDLCALLAKAAPVIAGSSEVLGEVCVDVTQVLVHFVEERVGAQQ